MLTKHHGIGELETLPTGYPHQFFDILKKRTQRESKNWRSNWLRSLSSDHHHLQPNHLTGNGNKCFFMQHYGIPTRLLDWTESPFIALYFALSSCERTAQGKPKSDAAFWMLDPAAWNKGALQDISYDGGILNPNREQVKSYSPKVDLAERKNLPVMIYGTHNSPRIVAQRGMFALFGKVLIQWKRATEIMGLKSASCNK